MLADSSVIVEYGAGTGAFTEEILDQKAPDACVLAIESNPAPCGNPEAEFPSPGHRRGLR